MDTTYRLRQTIGNGWVRELVDGSPIITALADEAAQWTSADDAHQAARAIRARRLVPVEVIAGPTTPRIEWGAPTPPAGAPAPEQQQRSGR